MPPQFPPYLQPVITEGAIRVLDAAWDVSAGQTCQGTTALAMSHDGRQVAAGHFNSHVQVRKRGGVVRALSSQPLWASHGLELAAGAAAWPCEIPL